MASTLGDPETGPAAEVLGDGQRAAPADGWLAAVPLVRALGGRWTIEVLVALSSGGQRYHELRRALGGQISHKVLTETLRRAERDGLLRRHVDGSRVETATLYQLTVLGRSLDEPLDAARRWVAQHWALVDAARRQWDDRDVNP